MPAMPRLNKQTRKIAYKINGIPVNMNVSSKLEFKKVQKRLVFEETKLVR